MVVNCELCPDSYRDVSREWKSNLCKKSNPHFPGYKQNAGKDIDVNWPQPK
jgi:hypothetical protein